MESVKRRFCIMKRFDRNFIKRLKNWSFLITSLFIVVGFCSPAFAQKEAVKDPQISKTQSGDQCNRRVLRAVLYPFIPAKTEFFAQIEQLFEARNDKIDLQIVDLSENYYNTKKPKNIIETNADIYEIDSVFLYDFVKNKRIQQLPAELVPENGEVLENARRGAQIDGKWYGSPHWVCGNFLFHAADDTAFRTVKNLSDLERIIGKSPGEGRGILIDLKGKSTLGELYLDAAFDRYVEQSQVAPHLDVFDSDIESDLRRAGLLCSKGFCRSDRYHDTTGFYARQFSRKRARALAGYSETLFYALSESQQSCGDGEGCLTNANIAVMELPLAARGSQPISWVDSLAIDGKCLGQCQRDAVALIRFLTSDEMFLEAVMPKYMQPSRYLLPARASVYSNQELIKQAPLYPKLRAIIEKAVTPTGEKLNDKLRAFGEKLDSNLNNSVESTP